MGGYNLLINGVFWGYTHLVNLSQLLGHPSTPTSREIQKLNEIDAFVTSSPTQNLPFERVFLFFGSQMLGGYLFKKY